MKVLADAWLYLDRYEPQLFAVKKNLPAESFRKKCYNTHFFPSQLKNSPTFAWILRGWTSTAGENVEINAGMWGENRSFNEHF